jgi:glycosyltransferase involved in cell wall biosynthesis
MKVSIVIPLHNEVLNVDMLYRELREFAAEEKRVAEIIFVDDGSTDGTYERLVQACKDDVRVTVLRLRRNFGQTAALSAGFDVATGDVICPMDGDLQNDPRDIPALLEKIDQGYDVVSGWRKERKDPWLTRRVPSWVANRLISKITSVRLRDYGCSLKAYRCEVLRGTKLYGEMHRFIPSLASWMGVRVAEAPVKHRPRMAGRSKYGLSRTLRVILDLINVKFLVSYSTRPIQVFGKIGVFSLLAGAVFLVLTIYMKFFAAERYSITGNPFFMLSALCVLIGVQFICIGLLGELTIRTYYELQDKPTYVVRESFRGGSSRDSRPGGQ